MSRLMKTATLCLFIGLVFSFHAQANIVEATLNQFTLPNGLHVIMNEDPARKVAAIQIWVKVGSADEKERERGISHVIEHMAFKGTERREVGEIAREIEALGGDTNAYTSWDETVFFVTVPADAALKGLDILTDAVLNPTIDPEELEKEKRVVLEEILEGEERPERKASKLLFRTAYVRSPYRFPVIGYRETVASFTRDDIIAFRNKWYVPENMFLVVSGAVDTEKLRPAIEETLGRLEPAGFFRPPRPKEPVQREVRQEILEDANARETRLHIAFHIPSIKGPEVNALDLAADILGARESSRLIRIIKNEKGLVNTISAFSLTPKNPGIFVLSATLDADKLEATVTEMMDQLRLLGGEAPTGEELKRAKVHIESEHLYARETVQGTARGIGSFLADTGDAQYEEKYLRLNQAVKPEDVSAVVEEYLRAPNVSLVALVPQAEAKKVDADTLKSIISDSRPKESSLAKEAAEEGAVFRTLSNGIRVVLVPDDSNAIVSWRIACLGGKRFETESDQGIMNFIARMWTKGAGDMDETEIYRKIEDMGGKLQGISGYDSLGLSTTFFSRYLDAGLSLLRTLYTEPTFPEDKVERERTLVLNRIKSEPDRPVQFALKTLSETLFPHHPYGFDKNGTPATVAGFTRNDFVDAYQRFIVPANTVISGVGDMDVDATMKLVEQLFGDLPGESFTPPDVPEEEPIKETRERTVRIPRAKAHLMLGFRATTFADKDRYALEVLNNVLAGQGGRLFYELRDKQSLAYVVTSLIRPGLDPGLFALYMACDVSNVDEALDGLFREIERVRSQPIPADELERAKSNLVGNHRIVLQSTWSRAESRVLNTLYGLGYDYDDEYIREIKQVTVDQALDAAKKYLDTDHGVVVKILPEDDAPNE